MKRIILALVVQFLALPAFATATYSFTGPPFATFLGSGYTTAMRVTGSFTTLAPLPANMPNSNIASQVMSYSFSDGVNTIASSDPRSVVALFYATTDGAGQITSAANIALQRWTTTPGVGNRYDAIKISSTGGGLSGGLGNAQCALLGGSICSGYSGNKGEFWGNTIVGAPGTWTLTASTDTDLTDIWWNPAEAGWGVQMVNTGSFTYVTIYGYGPDGKPAWFGGGLNPSGYNLFTGNLFAATGPYFGGAFDPAAVNVRQVGTMTFTLTGTNTGEFSYSVDGVVVNKSVQRQPLTLDDYSGNWIAGLTETVTGCLNPADNGTLTGTAAIKITQNGMSIIVAIMTPDGATCTIDGTYSQLGRMGEIQGPYSCTFGAAGVATLSQMNIVSRMFTARMQTESANLGCHTSAEVVALIPR